MAIARTRDERGEHIQPAADVWCAAVAIEHRYIHAIIRGATADGLSVAIE